jgi:hypothetical protein
MLYRNTEMKIDQFVNYLNDNKINLNPAFQRGYVWTLTGRKNLLKNILNKKPIPAIFLYKEASGSKYSYNILDGKQRLESIILYIGDAHKDLKISRWKDYFFNSESKKHINVSAGIGESESSFSQLEDSDIRDFREYSIPTIEISLEETTNLDDVISLFVDINQQGVAVSRFNIVKAMCDQSPLLRSSFKLIAQKQKRGRDVFYKMIKNDITFCLKNVRDIKRIRENNYKVDRIWERLIDIIQYIKTENHKKPNDILKGFLNQKLSDNRAVNKKEQKKLRSACAFMNEVFEKISSDVNPLIYDYTHLYTAITMIISNDILPKYDKDALINKFVAWSEILEKKRLPGKSQNLQQSYKRYREASSKHSTDPAQRESRSSELLKIISMV